MRSVDDILGMIETVGRLVGAEAKALDIVAGLEAEIDKTRAIAAERFARTGKKPRVYFEEWDEPLISSIRWASELIEIAGGEDVFAERSHSPLAKDRRPTPEEVIARAPDIIIGSWCGKHFRPERVAARPGWEAIPAVNRKKCMKSNRPSS
jgi:iron complex transport system substrate-binding protein